eukprot:gene8947-896_t
MKTTSVEEVDEKVNNILKQIKDLKDTGVEMLFLMVKPDGTALSYATDCLQPIDETIRSEHLVEKCIFNDGNSEASSEAGSFQEKSFLEEVLALSSKELNFDEIWVEHRHESVYDMEMQEKSLWDDFTSEMNE